MIRAILCGFGLGLSVALGHYLFYVKFFPPIKSIKFHWAFRSLINLFGTSLTFLLVLNVGVYLNYFPVDKHGSQSDSTFQILVFIFYVGSVFWFGYLPFQKVLKLKHSPREIS
jgi:hypothetical protein